MTLLQPHLLYWGLPLILLPLVIHLLNRLRYRSVNWAAMMFLLTATRQSTRQARVKQYLILAVRMLVVLCVLLAVARPLIGGWLGAQLGGPPETVIVLLDRSASLEARLNDGQTSQRRHLLSRTAAAAEALNRPNLILIDSVTLAPQPFGDPQLLLDLPETDATDTAASLPQLLARAAQLLLEEPSHGRCEIWLLTDRQQSSWQPESDIWDDCLATLAAAADDVILRIFAGAPDSEPNCAVRVAHTEVVSFPDYQELVLDLIVTSATAAAGVPLTITLGDRTIERRLDLDPAVSQCRQRVRLQRDETSGWGRVQLPADQNPRDSNSWFAYRAAPEKRCIVVADDDRIASYVALAAAPAPTMQTRVERLPRDQIGSRDLADTAVIVWQGQSPAADAAAQLRAFVGSGGQLLCLPPAPVGPFLELLSWSAAETASADAPFEIADWESADALLAPGLTGDPLPLDTLTMRRRQVPAMAAEVIAAFADGDPWLLRRGLGDGAVICCTSPPHPEWSNFADGPVLVPLVQRLLTAGARRLEPVVAVACGAADADASSWRCLSEPGAEAAVSSGVFAAGDRLFVVNRPAAEDDPAAITEAELAARLAGLNWRYFADDRPVSERSHSELWQLCLLLLLLLLAAEAALTLPAKIPRQEVAAHG